MSVCKESVTTGWKRLWQLVSGIHFETPEKTVLEELTSITQELEDGVLHFKTASASKTKLDKLLEKEQKLLPFTQRLQELLDLESEQCWDLLCYYLTNEYRGSGSSITILTSTDTTTSQVLDDIWAFYTLERMIILKVVKNILLFYKSPGHPYQKEYKRILDKITLERLCESYIKQLEHLINENPPSQLANGEFFDYKTKLVTWSERNAREISEILQIILLICEFKPMNVNQIKQLFNCVTQHSFGRQQRYLFATESEHIELQQRLAYSELILCLKCLGIEDLNSKSSHALSVVQALEKDIVRHYNHAENGPLLLAWALLKTRLNSTSSDGTNCSQIFKRAVDLQCFKYLHSLLSSPLFKDDSLGSRIARKIVYDLLCYFCDLFDGDGSCARYTHIYELLCELVSWPTLAKDFCEHEGGVRSLYTTLMENFPLDFTHLSNLANALTKGGMGSFIKSQLLSLPVYTERYDEARHQLGFVSDDEYVILKPIQPLTGIDYVIPENTSTVVISHASIGYCAHFRHPVNYYHVLQHELNRMLNATTQDQEAEARVTAGLQFLCSTLQRIKSASVLTNELVPPSEMSLDLLSKYQNVPWAPVALLASCLNVCTALLPLADAEVVRRVRSLNILPVITSETLLSYQSHAQGMYFDSLLVGAYLVDVEKNIQRYEFLAAYLGFLRAYTLLPHDNYMDVELPGVIFLLREVFPHMHSWHFADPAEKNKLYAEVMNIICIILDAVTVVDDTKGKNYEQKKLMRDICVFSILNLENGVVLLRFVALGNGYLQHTMETEPNWMLQQSQGLTLLVRLAMRILMQVLRLKSNVINTTVVSPLESLIYTQPKQRDTLRIIPVVTSYMNNIFDRWLPLLSCRLLKRIALESNMSLLACLDMQPDQIRQIFLQKLPDELESDSLKIAILELVEACVQKQSGMTEAFFKVNYDSEKRSFAKVHDAQITESILTFIEDYLEAVAKDSHVVKNPLLSKVMNLISALWSHNMQILVEDLVKKPEFWTKLCNPLLSKDFIFKSAVYTQLLNIISIEIFCTPNKTNDNLKKVLLKFFKKEHFENWLTFIFDMPRVPAAVPPTGDFSSEEMPVWLCRLQAFKAFLLILLKKQPLFLEIPPPEFKLLADTCFETLVARAQYLDDLRPFILLSEMFLIILQGFKHCFTNNQAEDRKTLEQLIQMLRSLTSCYDSLHPRAKEAALSITIKFVHMLAHELTTDPYMAFNLLESLALIVCVELKTFENCVKAEKQESDCIESKLHCSMDSLVLCLNLLETVANVFQGEGPGNWDSPFTTNKIFQRLLSCTGSILQLHGKQRLSIELLDVLIVFAKSKCSEEFMHADVGDYLWLKLLPPKQLLEAKFTMQNETSAQSWTAEKWWPIYARGVEFVTVLFSKYKTLFLPDVLQFVGIHKEYLVDSLLLSKQSLTRPAINLIKCVTTFLSYVTEYQQLWRVEDTQSLSSLMNALQILMGHSISLFHQPKNLRCLITGHHSYVDLMRETEKSGANEEVVTALNDLTEIIILCVKCLKPFSPELLELICAPELSLDKWEPIFEIYFGAPKLNECGSPLSFGTVLGIVSVLTKALNLQNYAFHEVPLNELPVKVGQDLNATKTTPPRNRLSTSAGNKDTFARTLSVSINCPSNELLSNLDGDLCLMALEHVLSLSASQSLLLLKNIHLPPREKQLIRREISTELISYQEYVRKKVLTDQRDYRDHREHRELCHRRKHGKVSMFDFHGNNDEVQQPQPSTSRAATAAAAAKRSSELRVNLTRRLYLQHQHEEQERRKEEEQHQLPPRESNVFQMSQPMSPISAASGLKDPKVRIQAATSTPRSAAVENEREGLEKEQTEVNVGQDEIDKTLKQPYEIQAEEEIQYFPPEEPNYSSLSYVQLVEEDYLQFLSNLFTVICQTD